MLLWTEAESTHQASIKTGHGPGLEGDGPSSGPPQGTEQPGSQRQVNLDWGSLAQAEFMLRTGGGEKSLHMFRVVKRVGSEMEMCS